MTKEKKRKPVILIVDDDKQVLKSLKIWLKNEGFRPVTASDGDEALLQVEENPVEVALVDYRMNNEDGIQVAQRLRETDDTIKIIMLTGFPSYETAVSAMKVGVFDYISKGSSNEKILEAILDALASREPHETAEYFNSPEMGLKIILFCRHSLLKERLESYSQTRPGFKLIRSFPSMDASGITNVSQQVDIALICGGCNLKTVKEAFLVLPELYRLFPEIKPVIINENFSDQEKVDLLKLGVKGFAPRDLSSDKLEEILFQVKRGEIFVSRNVTHLSLQEMTTFNSSHILKENSVPFDLTEREVEVLRTMALGLKNKEIAQKLFISEKTVKTHINRLFHKLGVDTRPKAIFKAVEDKII